MWLREADCATGLPVDTALRAPPGSARPWLPIGGTARGWLLPGDRAGRGSQLRAGALRLLVAVCAKTQRHWASAGFSPLTRNKVATNRQHRSGESNQWGGCGPKGCTAPKSGFHHCWTTRHTGESYVPLVGCHASV